MKLLSRPTPVLAVLILVLLQACGGDTASGPLTAKYTELLTAQWEAHRALSTQVTAGDEQAMSPEQLRTLRALGYIQ